MLLVFAIDQDKFKAKNSTTQRPLYQAGIHNNHETERLGYLEDWSM